MVYFLFENERSLSESDAMYDRRAVVHAPRKAAPATPRHQLQLPDSDTPAVAAALAGWKPHLLPSIHSHGRAPHEPTPAPRREHEHPHQWRNAVIHAKNDFDA